MALLDIWHKTRGVSDLWFRSDREIADIFAAVTGSPGQHGRDTRWEWVKGTDPGTDLSLTVSREHRRLVLRDQADVRVQVEPATPLKDAALKSLVARLRPLADTPISAGRWIHKRGNTWKKVAVRRFLG